jgi:hypothetical protein
MTRIPASLPSQFFEVIAFEQGFLLSVFIAPLAQHTDFLGASFVSRGDLGDEIGTTPYLESQLFRRAGAFSAGRRALVMTRRCLRRVAAAT